MSTTWQSLTERFVWCVEDRTERFDNYFPRRRQRCRLARVEGQLSIDSIIHPLSKIPKLTVEGQETRLDYEEITKQNGASWATKRSHQLCDCIDYRFEQRRIYKSYGEKSKNSQQNICPEALVQARMWNYGHLPPPKR
jgi:hypothetical protein